jgi:hypothetical protein
MPHAFGSDFEDENSVCHRAILQQSGKILPPQPSFHFPTLQRSNISSRHHRAAVNVDACPVMPPSLADAIRSASDATSWGATRRFCGAIAANNFRISLMLLPFFGH